MFVIESEQWGVEVGVVVFGAGEGELVNLVLKLCRQRLNIQATSATRGSLPDHLVYTRGRTCRLDNLVLWFDGAGNASHGVGRYVVRRWLGCKMRKAIGQCNAKWYRPAIV